MQSFYSIFVAVATVSAVITLTAPAHASTFQMSCHAESSEAMSPATLTVNADPLNGKLSYVYKDDEQEVRGAMGRSCHPIFGGSTVSFSQSGNIPTNVSITASGYSVCRLNVWSFFALELAKDWRTDSFIVTSFAAASEFGVHDLQKPQPVVKPKLAGAICVMDSQG